MNGSMIFVLLPLLAGCHVDMKNAASGDENISIQADDNGDIAFNLPIAQGQVKVPASYMHNGNFDIDGVKLMPGSSVTGFSMVAHDEGATVNMVFAAPASPDQVRSYFFDEFKKQGTEVALAGDAVSGKTKDGSPFTIQVAPAASGSKGTIVVQAKD